tara:strand:- start:1281 stop:1715 length:435 start_codon:yes stop_codon:yes gene_type:complete
MVSNIGRNVAPDPWTDFGASGSKAQDASWVNPTAIDMTQYESILLEVEPGDTFAAADVEITLGFGDDAEAIQWGDVGAQDMKTYVNEPLQQGMADTKKQILSFGDSQFTLLGVDALYITLTNKNASAKEMDGIRYRRVGFRPAG